MQDVELCGLQVIAKNISCIQAICMACIASSLLPIFPQIITASQLGLDNSLSLASLPLPMAMQGRLHMDKLLRSQARLLAANG